MFHSDMRQRQMDEKRGSSSAFSSASSAQDNVKPWLESRKRKRANQKVFWTFATAMLLAAGVIAMMMITTYFSTTRMLGQHNYCLILDENFEGDRLNTDIWHQEQQTGGWGTGEFEMTTDSVNNSFVKDGKLYIVPTLTSDRVGEAAIMDGYTLNLTASNTCTSANTSDIYCAASSNLTKGTILPPVQSARISTRLSKSIRFGKVEVKARMPTGDWIWPAIWMMPVKETYGQWPASGEIDIFEGKGNPTTQRKDGLSARMLSTLHWGPVPAYDRYRMTHNFYDALQRFWNKSFRTIGLQWDAKRLAIWHDTRAQPTYQVDFQPGGFWKKGQFPPTLWNGTVLNNPWTTGNGAIVPDAAPFDQEFYLILSVAVGSQNGYFFEDDSPYKRPWTDQSENPARDFWLARDKWLPTWPTNVEDRAMVVESVKIWSEC